MLRKALGGVLWVARCTATVLGLAVMLALVLGVGTMALAAVPGDPFKLGQNNSINNALTALGGVRAGGAMMLVDNNSSAAGSRALDLRSEPGRAPLTVNADAGKAANFNADRVDGRSFSCPAGTLFHAGVCFDTAPRGVANWPNATNDCEDENKRLPTVAELLTFRNISGTGFAAGGEFSLETDNTDSTGYFKAVEPDGDVFLTQLQGNYRCVVPPS